MLIYTGVMDRKMYSEPFWLVTTKAESQLYIIMAPGRDESNDVRNKKEMGPRQAHTNKLKMKRQFSGRILVIGGANGATKKRRYFTAAAR